MNALDNLGSHGGAVGNLNVDARAIARLLYPYDGDKMRPSEVALGRSAPGVQAYKYGTRQNASGPRQSASPPRPLASGQVMGNRIPKGNAEANPNRVGPSPAGAGRPAQPQPATLKRDDRMGQVGPSPMPPLAGPKAHECGASPPGKVRGVKRPGGRAEPYSQDTPRGYAPVPHTRVTVPRALAKPRGGGGVMGQGLRCASL